MRQFAFGSLGWTPEVFYCASLVDYADAQQGYCEEKNLQQHYLRRQAYIIHASLVEKPANPITLWPIGDELERLEKDQESFKERMLRKNEEAVKRQQQKHSQGG